jgi:chondroitin sulfate proteoglycan 4
VNNTGLILTHRTAAHITTANLTFTSNAEDADLDVRYEVVKPPQFGAVQRVRGGASDSQWQTVEHFTSHQLARDQIRYLHMSGDPTHDSFKVGSYISKAGNLWDTEIATNFTNR